MFETRADGALPIQISGPFREIRTDLRFPDSLLELVYPEMAVGCWEVRASYLTRLVCHSVTSGSRLPRRLQDVTFSAVRPPPPVPLAVFLPNPVALSQPAVLSPLERSTASFTRLVMHSAGGVHGQSALCQLRALRHLGGLLLDESVPDVLESLPHLTHVGFRTPPGDPEIGIRALLDYPREVELSGAFSDHPLFTALLSRLVNSSVSRGDGGVLLQMPALRKLDLTGPPPAVWAPPASLTSLVFSGGGGGMINSAESLLPFLPRLTSLLSLTCTASNAPYSRGFLAALPSSLTYLSLRYPGAGLAEPTGVWAFPHLTALCDLVLLSPPTVDLAGLVSLTSVSASCSRGDILLSKEGHPHLQYLGLSCSHLCDDLLSPLSCLTALRDLRVQGFGRPHTSQSTPILTPASLRVLALLPFLREVEIPLPIRFPASSLPLVTSLRPAASLSIVAHTEHFMALEEDPLAGEEGPTFRPRNYLRGIAV